MKKILSFLENLRQLRISRRQFLKAAIAGAIVSLTHGRFFKKAFAADETSKARPKKGIKGDHDLVLVEGADPYANTVEAVRIMGGMERFVKKGGVVVIKPNIAWDRTPDQAANTDPDVVAALVDLSYKAGAAKVKVFDVTCNDARRCYERSGIQKAARDKGAEVYFADDWNVVKASFDYESPMEGWPVLRDAVVCDTFINVPVLKHHGLTGLTLSMKNLMGVCTGSRGMIHMNIGRKLADLTDFIGPDLTVIDAHRVLTRNGPSGGNLKDVVTMNKLLVATDPTLADAYASQLMNIDPMRIPYIQAAAERKLGSVDINGADIQAVKL